MKKSYNTPKVRLSLFSRESILTTSANPEAYDELLEKKSVNTKNITVHDTKLVF